jgi:hypothetical protein
LATAAALLSGCSATDGLMTSVELPTQATGASGVPNDPAASALPVSPGSPQSPPARLVVTGQQRAYLDALAAGGLHPSSDLLALRIGSYICQARAAGQSDEAVWDYVHPLVSNDMRPGQINSSAPSANDADAATQSYIRIATERLC